MLRAFVNGCVSLAVLVGIAGCRDEGGSEKTELTVLAAASLGGAFGEIEPAFERVHPGVDLALSFSGSQIAASQIIEGIAADVFCSADERQMERVAEFVRTPRVFATNRLVVVMSTKAPIDFNFATPTEALLGCERVVLAGEHVPAGQYARSSLKKMGALDEVLERTVSFEDDVRGVLTKIVLGEGDAGIVYATDAASAAEGALRTVAFDAGVSEDVVYPAAVLGDSAHAGEGELFIEFLLSDAGGEILRRHGFGSP